MSANEGDSQATRKEPRDRKGRYEKGHSGNRKGRPPKRKRVFTESQHCADILEITDEEMNITRHGTRQKEPAFLVVLRQLTQKAAGGEVRCMLEVLRQRRDAINALSNERKELAELASSALQFYQDRPESFTDAEVKALLEIKRRLKDLHTIHRP